MYYIEDETFEPNSLMQGDILSNIHLLGAIHFGIIQYITATSDEPSLRLLISQALRR